MGSRLRDQKNVKGVESRQRPGLWGRFFYLAIWINPILGRFNKIYITGSMFRRHG
jgi:hypothetical protein